MHRTTPLILALVLGASAGGRAQTTTAPGIDLELVDPTTGANRLCVAPGADVHLQVWLRPGDDDGSSCTLACSPPAVAGGPAHLATALVDVGFEPDRLTLSEAASNPDPTLAAVDGLVILDNLAEGRVGWALAGDWSPDGDPDGTLADPCTMATLDREGWLVALRFVAADPGMTSVHLRREEDPLPFDLSFADACGSPTFSPSSGHVDELRDAVVLVSHECDAALFFDPLEDPDLVAWSGVVGSEP